MSATVEVLIEMGFSKKRAEEAVEKTSNTGVESAMEWLISHEEVPSTAPTAITENKESAAAEAAAAETEDQQANSLKCEDCGKMLKGMEEAEVHATRTGHSNFTESTNCVQPLTEEEKQAQLLKVNELLKIKRKEREEREKKEQLERERSRRNVGKEISIAKQRHDEIEMKKILDQRKRDKEEEKRVLQKVREQIAKDKEDREVKFGMTSDPVEATPAPVLAPQPTFTAPTAEYTETKLQVRLLDGSKLVEAFKVEETLAAVRLFVQQKAPLLASIRFSFSSPFPRKEFSDEDMQTSLKELGLVPSAVLIIKKLT